MDSDTNIPAHPEVLIIGGGIAGLAVANNLSALGISSHILEKGPFLGGHGIQFACKAAGGSCRKCSACSVEEHLKKATEDPGITIMLNSRLKSLAGNQGIFKAVIEQGPILINPEKCSNCGECYRICSSDGTKAIQQAYSIHNHPGYAVDVQTCLYQTDEEGCEKCKDACPEKAITLDAKPETVETEFNAVVVASGFTPADPTEYSRFGYGVHKNVISAIELEQTLRRKGRITRPSDGMEPERIAFIQCVGSRSKKHPFCSRACCGYAIRMAGAIRERQPGVDPVIFYIDIQNFGKEFLKEYDMFREKIHMVRMIPGDIYRTEGDRLLISYMDHSTHQVLDEKFDLAVLSVGLMPGSDNRILAELLEIELTDTGFFALNDQTAGPETAQKGIFIAGTAGGPMDIADTISQAGRAAWEAAIYCSPLPHREEKEKTAEDPL